MRTVGKVEPARLRAFDLFAGLNEEELQEVAEACQEYRVPSGSILIRQGQVGRDLFLMEEGSVRIYSEKKGETQFLGTVRAPEVLGEMALMTPERVRTANVEALSDLHLLGISLAQFILFLRRFPTLKSCFHQLIATRTSSQ
jgi:CRP-like cAMP-binding protein